MNHHTSHLVDIFSRVVKEGGGEVTEEMRSVLMQSAETLESNAITETIVACRDGFCNGWLRNASRGYEFVPVERVRVEKGSSLEENYPEASQEFLLFAKTYWTYKILLQDSRGDDSIVVRAMRTLDSDALGPLFFPVPGPATVDPAMRERHQREVLGSASVEMNIDAFIAGNPILIRDRKATAAGYGCGVNIGRFLQNAALGVLGIGVLLIIIAAVQGKWDTLREAAWEMGGFVVLLVGVVAVLHKVLPSGASVLDD